MKKVLLALVSVIAALPALAQEGADHAAAAVAATGGANEWIPLAAGLAIAIAAFGGALGQGKTATAALEGIARNPSAQDKIFIPMIIGLALIESLVIYAFVIAIMMTLKL